MTIPSLLLPSIPVRCLHLLLSPDIYRSKDHYNGHILSFLEASVHGVRDEAWYQSQLKLSKILSLTTLQPPPDKLLFLVRGDKENWHLIWKVSWRPQWVSEWVNEWWGCRGKCNQTPAPRTKSNISTPGTVISFVANTVIANTLCCAWCRDGCLELHDALVWMYSPLRCAHSSQLASCTSSVSMYVRLYVRGTFRKLRGHFGLLLWLLLFLYLVLPYRRAGVLISS
jgi:hypothetical protein